jgi:pimeloyl-ACP methyl ester carboxylesterase
VLQSGSSVGVRRKIGSLAVIKKVLHSRVKQRTARLVKGAWLVVVKGGPHCITWTHTEEVNAALFNFFGEKNVAPA